MQTFMDFAQSLPYQTGLDEKTFQLIYIALQAQNGAVGSVAAHTGLAKKAGATKEEVVGAVLTTLLLGITASLTALRRRRKHTTRRKAADCSILCSLPSAGGISYAGPAAPFVLDLINYCGKR
jgi:AhpD family alkylhydroperoxidase